MKPIYHKPISIWIFSSFIVYSVHSQNLAPNPDFEIYTTCPTWLSGGGPLECVPWGPANGGSPDYFHVCATAWICDVPTNLWGYQQPRSGDAYTGASLKDISPNYREYIQAPLTQPLIAGMAYWVAYYVNICDDCCGIKTIGALFTNGPPTYPFNDDGALDYSPQVESNIGFINEDVEWVLISGCFLAKGGESYITIGNFHDDANTPVDPACAASAAYSYYFFEDILVEPMTPEFFDLDLGDPVVACFSYEIDPGLSTSFQYTWEDGSHAPTLTVTESGTYAVTIADDCVFGIDSIEVIILGTSIVELGPPEIDLCEGDLYEISLDPNLGDYQWQDGSTNPEYTITTPGLYQVTLDDGCLQSTDEVQVNVFNPPSPSFLGPDVSICPGDEIDFSFGPDQAEYIWQDGSTEPDYSITVPGNYALTISNICGEFSDDVDVSLIPPIDFNLGPDELTICEGTSYDIELDPTLGQFLWQDGSNSNFYSMADTGIYAVTVSNVCESVTDSIEILFIEDPVFSLGPDLVICENQLPVLLDLSDVPDVLYQWQDGSNGSAFLATASGTYSVTVSNACYEEYDQVEVTVLNSTVTVVLPADQSLCQGQSFVITNSGEAGNYTWQDNSNADSLLVSTPGIYALTVNTQCGVGSDTVVINYIPAVAVPDLGPDVSLCPGEQLVLSPNISGVTFLWSDNSTADSLLVTSAGTYFVQVADQCTSTSDTIQVVLNNNPPQLALPAQLNLCQGDSVTLDAVISGVSYLWNDNSQASTLSVSSPGTYILTVSNSCGSDIDTVTVLDAGPLPSVSLGNDVQLCPGDVVPLLPVYSDVTSWLWSDGSTGDSYSVNGDELVTVEVNNSCGVSFDTLIATLLPATPPIDLGADTSLCPGITLLLSILTPNVIVEWSDGSVNNQFQVNGPGNYFATISNSCGENSDTITVSSLPPAPILNLGIDQSLCPGEVITIDPGINNVNYLWQDGSTDSSFNATQAGLIILTVSNSCGFDTDSLNIVLSNNGPDVNLGPDVLACEGDVVTLMSDISGVSYLWQDGSAAASYSTSSSGLYYLQVSNNCGVDIDSVNVDINGSTPDTELGPDTTLCKGNTLILSSTADQGTTLQWQDGSSLSTFVVNTAGSYSLSESNHCGVHADTVNINFLDPPIAFDLGPDTSLCPGEFILLLAPFTTSTIQWQDGSNGPSFLADKEQTYSLELSNSCGTARDELVLSFDDRVPNIKLDSVFSWCPGAELELNVTQLFPASYLWNTGSTSPILTIETQGHYSVNIQVPCANGYGETDIVLSDTCFSTPSFFVPNVFSPNGDNINDVFSVMTNTDIEIKSIQGTIYDRWGNIVFESNTIPFEWKGDFNGTLLNPGVFVYRIEASYFDQAIERSVILSGDVTLVR